jgi:hypothetical protein
LLLVFEEAAFGGLFPFESQAQGMNLKIDI